MTDNPDVIKGLELAREVRASDIFALEEAYEALRAHLQGMADKAIDLVAELTKCLPTMEDGPDARTWCSVRGDHLRRAVAALAQPKQPENIQDVDAAYRHQKKLVKGPSQEAKASFAAMFVRQAAASKRDYVGDLGFELVEKSDVWLVIDGCGNEREASLEERVLWGALIESEQPARVELPPPEELDADYNDAGRVVAYGYTASTVRALIAAALAGEKGGA